MTTSPVDAAVEVARRASGAVTVRPATVVEWAFDTAPVMLIVDGDETAVAAVNGLGVPLRPGARVMVLLAPPSGATVVGLRGMASPPWTAQAPVTPPSLPPVQSIPAGAWTTVAFSTMVGDLPVFPAGNPMMTGRFDVTATVTKPGDDGRFVLAVVQDGHRVPVTYTREDSVELSVQWTANVTETLTLKAFWQPDTGTLPTDVYLTSLMIVWTGPAAILA